MPRYKKYDYSQSQLLPINFNEQILPGTLEYTIHYVVDNKINLSRLEKRFRNDETGAPHITIPLSSAHDAREARPAALFSFCAVWYYNNFS